MPPHYYHRIGFTATSYPIFVQSIDSNDYLEFGHLNITVSPYDSLYFSLTDNDNKHINGAKTYEINWH